MYHIYSITFSDTFDTYVGITRDLDLTKQFHEDCERDVGCTSALYVHMRLHPFSWDLRLLSSHDTCEEARERKVIGSLNVYDRSIKHVPTIYKIFCLDPEISDMYIGQTINYESRKFSHFLNSVTQTSNVKLYEFIRSHGGWFNWKMEIVFQYDLETCSKTDLDRLEWYWWNKLGGTLNSMKPGTRRDKYRGCDETFEECVRTHIPRGEKFSIKEISLDI
jgi:hypothetical protein